METIQEESVAVTCLADNTVHPSVAALHAHLKKYRVKQSKYYEEYHPRKDKLTGEPIEYKDYDQYFSQEFRTKTNLNKWLKANKEEGLVWATNWLRHRKESKQLTYAPCEVELRTLSCPAMSYYQAAAPGGYYPTIAALGFVNRFDDIPLIDSKSILPSVASIIQDTREQKPIKIGLTTTVGTLDVGDYALAAPHDRGIRIERKSLADFCSSLSGRKIERKSGSDSNYERLDRELRRAVEANLYVIMMVESNINEAQSYNYLPHMRHIKATPSYVMHQLRHLLVKYPLHFQCLFVDGRVEMARVMKRLFELGDIVKRVDLQWQYQSKQL